MALPIFSSYNVGTTVSRKLLGVGPSIETIFFGGFAPFLGFSEERVASGIVKSLPT